MTVRSCSLLGRMIEPDWSRSGRAFLYVFDSTAKHRTPEGSWQPSASGAAPLLNCECLVRFGLKLRRCHAGLLAEIAAEICDVGKAQTMRDLLDRHVRINEVALCFAHEMLVNDRKRRA